MAHPYSLAHHHPHRANHPTPASSVSQLSTDGSHPPPPLPFDTALAPSSSSTSSLPMPAQAIARDIPTATSTSTGPQRRRRRSIRAPPKPGSRKKSEAGSAPSSSAASLSEEAARKIDETHIPTRVYQFKSFDSFDAGGPKPGDIPAGSEYTFFPPSKGTPPSDSVALPIAGPSQPARPSVLQPKKSSALLNVGKRVVKEVLGGGKSIQAQTRGNYAPPSQEAKAVYYGRGGAGGAGQRPNKPSHPATVAVPSPHPASQSTQSPHKPSAESHRSSSYYTGSSGYTPSIVSSPYAESIASSPYATSVDDASVYADSSHSASHNLSLRHASRPSPSHRSVSPAGFSDSRRDSIASSFPGTQSASDGDDAFDASGASGSYWSSPLGSGSQRQLTPHLPDEIAPAERFTELPAPAIREPSTYRRDTLVREEIGAGSAALRHRPSKPSMLSYSSGIASQSSPPTSVNSPSLLSAAMGYSYFPSSAPIRSTDTALGAMPAGQAQAAPLPMPIHRHQVPPAPTSSLMGAVTEPGRTEVRMPAGASASPSPLPQYATVDPTYAAWPQTVPHASRPLPDPLAQAVGQLSLIQNPLNVGWPIPQHLSQYYGPSANQAPAVSSQASAPYATGPIAEQFHANPGTSTPNYPSQLTSHTPSTAYSDPSSSGEDEYQKALAEQQALARRIAILEQLQLQQQQQQAAGMLYQQQPYSDSGRTM